MGLGKLVWNIAERNGYRLYQKAGMPWGVDHIVDIQRLSRALDHPVRTIFDVGANVGQAARSFLGHFTEARVHSFEPDPQTFQQLSSGLQSNRFQAHNFALGAETGEQTLYRYEGQSVINSMVEDAPYAVRFGRQGSPLSIDVQTLDAFCAAQSIDHVDLLKIDTEGFDIAVLKGARETLRRGAITFVYTEFNEVAASGRSGTTLMALEELLAPLSYKLVAPYTDYIVPEGDLFAVRNALYVHQRGPAG